MSIVQLTYKELPIACTLDPAQLSERLDEIGAIGRAALLE
jgi:hypothetical protein